MNIHAMGNVPHIRTLQQKYLNPLIEKIKAFVKKIFALITTFILSLFYRNLRPNPSQPIPMPAPPSPTPPVTPPIIQKATPPNNPVKTTISRQSMQQIGKSFFNSFFSITKKANEKAMQRLISDLEQINPNLAKKFKEQGLAALGAEFVDGSTSLTTDIQNALKDLASNQNSFDEFKAKMAQEIKSGKFHSSNVRTQFKAFFELNNRDYKSLSPAEKKVWDIEYKNFLRTVVFQNELKNVLQNRKALPGSKFERAFLKQCGLGDSDNMLFRMKMHDAEIAFIERELHAYGSNEDINELKANLYKDKMVARITAAGVSPSEAPIYAAFILNLEKLNESRLLEVQEIFLEDLPAHYPPASKKKLIYDFRKRLENNVITATKVLIKNIAKKDNHAAVMKTLSLETLTDMHRFIFTQNKLVTRAQIATLKQALFHTKWRTQIGSRELIQGQDDDQAVFLEGVCHGICQRWVKNEMNHVEDNADFLNDPALYEVKPIDRLNQARYASYRDLARKRDKRNKKETSISDIQYSSFLRKKMNISNVNAIVTDSIDEVQAQFNTPENRAIIEKSNGVASISLAFKDGIGHAIYIRFDKKRNQFRVGDPNVGIAVLKDEKEFFEYMKDLLDWYQTPISAMGFFFLEPKTQ